RSVTPAVQRVVNRPDETPQRVGQEADDHRDQHQLAEWVADQEDKASRQICCLSTADAERNAQGQQAHDDIEDTAGNVANTLEELELGILGRALNGGFGDVNI